MGLLIGVPVLLVGLILPDGKAYLTRCLVAFVVVAATALAVGLGALLVACLTITRYNLTMEDYEHYPNVVDVVAFERAGFMHGFSYLGGFIGILTGSVYLIIARVRLGLLVASPKQVTEGLRPPLA